MEAKLDLWVILFIAAAAQGLFLVAMLLLKQVRKKRTDQYLLTALMLSFTVTIAYYTTFWMHVNNQMHTGFRVILQFTYLFGPLAYLYLYHTLHKRFPTRAWLHFVPFVVMGFFFMSATRLFPGFSAFFLFGVLQTAHLLVYAFMNFWLCGKFTGHLWSRKVALSFGGYAICFLAYYVLVWTRLLELQHDYIVSAGMTLFIYFIGYHGFKSPLQDTSSGPEEKYQKSSLTENTIEYIVNKLDKVMREEKLFTKGDLKLQEVADALDIGVHALSQAINVSKGVKFTEYLSQLRVEEAIHLMRQKEYQDIKLLAVGIDAGFNNKTSFLNAFKKYTGKSPSEYRKSLYAKAS